MYSALMTELGKIILDKVTTVQSVKSKEADTSGPMGIGMEVGMGETKQGGADIAVRAVC